MTTDGETLDGLSIDEISGERIKNGLIKAVKKRLKTDNVKLWIEHGSKKGDNFIGEIYRILYKDADNENNDKQSSLILKIAPRNSMRRERANVRNLFLREINMYDQVLSYFYDFQVSKGVVPKENGFNEYPRCYFSISEEVSESLFLEDLGRRKFEMVRQREEPVTYEHLSLLMKALGKFHAISFAVQDQQPDKFKQLTTLVPEQYWTIFQEELAPIFIGFVDRIKTILKEENRPELLERFNRVCGDNLPATVLRIVSGATAEPYAVICHGDLTVNNTMYSKNDQNTPVEIQLFDWQFSRYASPVTDLVLYLFCSTTKELRDQHYEEFLKIYHESLADLLARLGSDPAKVFPYEVLLEQFRKFAVYGVFVGSMLLPMYCADIESMPDFDDMPETVSLEDNVMTISEASKPAYNQRVLGIFDDMVRHGYI